MKKNKLFSMVVSAAMCISLLAGCSTNDPAPPVSSSTPAAASSSVDTPKTSNIDYPETVTIVCGYSAGGSSDFMCRTLAVSLEKILGVTVIVEDMPGSSGWIALNEMFETKPEDADGSRLYLAGTGTAFGKYDPDNPREYFYTDFIPMASEVVDYGLIAIRNDETRFTDLASMLEYAKSNELMIGASGSNILSDDVNAMQKFKNIHGMQYSVVQTDGAGDTEVLFLQGSTDVLFANVGDCLSDYNEGTYKVLAVMAPERSALMPDVPTVEELGLGNIYNFSLRGYGYPAGTPDEIVDWMLDGLEKAINDEETIAALAATGAETVCYLGDDFTQIISDDLDSALEAWGIAR